MTVIKRLENTYTYSPGFHREPSQVEAEVSVAASPQNKLTFQEMQAEFFSNLEIFGDANDARLIASAIRLAFSTHFTGVQYASLNSEGFLNRIQHEFPRQFNEVKALFLASWEKLDREVALSDAIVAYRLFG